MPRTFRRKFSRRFVRRGTRGNGAKRMKSGYGVKALNFVKRHAPSILKFGYSYFCKQPFPDRYDTWLSFSNAGFTAAGVSTVSWGFGLSTPVFPGTQNNGLGGIPNAFQLNNTAEPAGLKNILFNTSTTTGLYNKGVVLGVRVELVVMPQAAGDTVYVAMAPVGPGGVSNYGSVITCGQGPNSISKVCEFSVPAASNTLANYYSLPSLLGQSVAEYISNPTVSFTFASAPTNGFALNVFVGTSDTANTTAPLTYQLRVMYHVLFFARVDTSLIDT